MEVNSVWKSALAELELSLSRANFETWIKPTKLIELKSNGSNLLAQLQVPSGFYQQMLSQRYVGQIQNVLEKRLGKHVEIVFTVSQSQSLEEDKITKSSQNSEEQPLFAMAQNSSNNSLDRSRRGFLNPRLTFDTFVVGSSNNFAHAAALGVVQNPGRKYNPLFIYGGVGLGKTHLMHAIGHALLDKYPDFKILYISTETFVNDLISSLKSKKTTAFKKRYRSCDVLLVDDIQFISGKESTQEEFFHTFNELYMAEKQIILTSDRPPEEIPRVEERLTSRFLGGLTVDIQPPDFEMRVGILQQKVKEIGVEAEAEALEIIAEKVSKNVRELEGELKKVLALAEMRGMSLNKEIVEAHFGTKKQKRERKRVRPTSVIARTAKYFELSSSDVRGKSRKAPIVHARHMAMYILKSELNLSLERIGELFGGRDHTTVMHGVDKIKTLINKDNKTADEYREICGLIWE